MVGALGDALTDGLADVLADTLHDVRPDAVYKVRPDRLNGSRHGGGAHVVGEGAADAVGAGAGAGGLAVENEPGVEGARARDAHVAKAAGGQRHAGAALAHHDRRGRLHHGHHGRWQDVGRKGGRRRHRCRCHSC